MVKPTRKIAWIAALIYFVQGALGISGIALLLYLRQFQWSVSQITTVISLGALPWVLKTLYGLITDSFPILGYRRKSYLMLASLVSSAGWFCLSQVPPDRFWVLVSLWVANIGFAMTDVAADGLLVEHSTTVSSHIYQSIAWGARSFGAIVSSLLGGVLAARWRAHEVFALTMALPLMIFAASFFIHEKKWTATPFKSFLEPFRICGHLIASSNLRWLIVLFLIISLPSTFGLPFFFFMKESLGFHETFLGLLGGVGWFGAVLGSIVYARWLKNKNPKTILDWAICLNCLNIVGALFIFDVRSAFILIFCGGVTGCITVLPMVSAAARLTRHSGIEGMMFAVLMSFYNLCQILFGYLGGKLYPVMGLYPLILLAAAVSLLGLVFVPKFQLERKDTR